MARGKVLLTGGSGFLGSRIARRLSQEGFELLLLVRRLDGLTELDRMDLTGKVELALCTEPYSDLGGVFGRFRPDLVVHVAASSALGDDAASVRQLTGANILLPALLLAHMREHEVKYFVNTGSHWQHARGDSFVPFNLYAATKQSAEDILQAYCNDGTDAVTLQLFDTYGPRDPRKKIVNLIVDATRTGIELAMSPGEQILDLIHVEDAARAYLVAVNRLLSGSVHGHEIFALSGERVSLKTLAAMIGEIAGRSAPIFWGGRPYRPREIMVPWTGFVPLPDWQRSIALRDGLREVYRSRSRAGLQQSPG